MPFEFTERKIPSKIHVSVWISFLFYIIFSIFSLNFVFRWAAWMGHTINREDGESITVERKKKGKSSRKYQRSLSQNAFDVSSWVFFLRLLQIVFVGKLKLFYPYKTVNEWDDTLIGKCYRRYSLKYFHLFRCENDTHTHKMKQYEIE